MPDPRRAAEREIDLIEEQMEDASPAEQKELRAEIRDIEREAGDYERWEGEGNDRGYW